MVLRPDGFALNTWTLKRAVLPGSDVVKFAPGLGVAASATIEVGPAPYVGVECNPNAPARVNAIASNAGCYVNADTVETGLSDESVSVVIDETMLSMRGEKVKRAIMNEAARILYPGDHYVIHELGVCPDSIAEGLATEICRVLARVINANTRPLTAVDWRQALEEVGPVTEEARMAPMALLKPGRVIADEGVFGTLRIMCNVIRDKDLRERVTAVAHTFEKYNRHLCGIAIVTRKSRES